MTQNTADYRCRSCGASISAISGLCAACDACEPPEPVVDAAAIDDGPCWCGEENPHFSDELDETCEGSGLLQCFCGGDLCVCHWHGEVECDGCPDCEGLEFDADDYPEHDDETPEEEA